jgi:phosphoribosylanthranilate isomerase
MTVKVKVCGVTRVDDARAAVALGATLLGLNFYPRSPRHLGVEVAAEIAGAVRGQVKLVGVFVNSTAEEVETLDRQLGLDLLQFHGDESPAFIARSTLRISPLIGSAAGTACA